MPKVHGFWCHENLFSAFYVTPNFHVFRIFERSPISDLATMIPARVVQKLFWKRPHRLVRSAAPRMSRNIIYLRCTINFPNWMDNHEILSKSRGGSQVRSLTWSKKSSMSDQKSLLSPSYFSFQRFDWILIVRASSNDPIRIFSSPSSASFSIFGLFSVVLLCLFFILGLVEVEPRRRNNHPCDQIFRHERAELVSPLTTLFPSPALSPCWWKRFERDCRA